MNEAFTPSSVIHNGDCREVMATLAADSIDSIVTDPPYGLSFMGKEWDHGVPGVEFWVEAIRVAKPGAHLLAFGGTRTYHRLACAIEDAGWEVRDCIAWVYGSGFPKSHDVSKAIDREAGAEREVVRAAVRVDGRVPQLEKGNKPHDGYKGGFGADRLITAPATEAAKQWQGWGTALKPAYEPIIVARKPLVGTVAQNVIQYGTGGINVDGCRVHSTEDCARKPSIVNDTAAGFGKGLSMGGNGHNLGRWPANFIHDGSDEVVGLFPQSNGGAFPKKSNIPTGKHYDGGWGAIDNKERTEMGNGSAARFFYCAKASKADRDAGCEKMMVKELKAYGDFQGTLEHGPKLNVKARNHHTTVKPTDLMRYLCRLVTPPGGTVLDPFCGSGSTGKGAILEGFNFIGIEREAEYVEIAKSRTEWARKNYQPTLF